MDTTGIIALCVALVIAGMLILLFKKRVIDADAISGVGQVIDGIPAETGTPFGMIREYARIAVGAVEQLVKTGKIKPEDKARKDAAMNMIEAAAKVDGLPYGAAEMEVADCCVEAEVNKLPHSQKPPNEAAEG